MLAQNRASPKIDYLKNDCANLFKIFFEITSFNSRELLTFFGNHSALTVLTLIPALYVQID